MLLDHCYAFSNSSLKKKFVEELDPETYIAPPWICPWADLAEKQQHL